MKQSNCISNKTIALLLLCTLGLISTGFSQDKWVTKAENVIKKSNERYHFGDYHAAQNATKSWLKKARRKGNMHRQHYSYISILNTLYLEGLGLHMQVRDSLENSIFYFNQNVTKDSSTYISCLIAIGDVYRTEGNLIKAKEYYSKAKTQILNHTKTPRPLALQDTTKKIKKSTIAMQFDPGKNRDSLLLNEVLIREFEVQIGLGFHKNTVQLLEPITEFQTRITQKKFPVNHPQYKKSSIKLKKSEYKARQEQLASLYVLKADFYRGSGNYKKAATLYYDNEKTFKKMVHKRSLPVVKNHLGKTVMAENDGRLKHPYENYQEIKRIILRSQKVSTYHQIYNEVAEKEIESYIKTDNAKKARDLYLKYKLDNQHKYGMKSAYFLRAVMLENAYFSKKLKYKKALEKEEKLKKDIEAVIPFDHMEQLKFNDHFYEFYKHNHRVEEARIERETNEWISKLNLGENAPAYSIELLKLASFNVHNQDQFNASKQVFKHHFDGVFTKQYHYHHPMYTNFLSSYSLLKTYNDEYDEAYTMSGECLRIAQEKFGPKSEEYGLAQMQMADINILKGEFDQAELQLESASEIIKTLGKKKSYNYYLSLKSLAELYMVNGKYDKAKDTYKKAYKLLKKSGEGGDITIKSSEDMAKFYMTTGRYKVAEEILEKSIELNEKKFDEDHYRLVEPLNLYGQLYLILGEYIKAEKKVQRAMEIAKNNLGDTSVSYMDNLTLLGEIYISMGNYDDAKTIYNDALTLIRKKFEAGNIREAHILQQLADANFRSENPSLDIINGYLDEAKDIVITNFNSSHPDYASILEYQGKVYMLFEKYAEAEQMLGDASKIWLDKFGRSHINTARNEMLEGDLFYAQKIYKKAEKHYNNAASSYKSLFDDKHPGYLEAKSKLGRSYFSNDELAKAKSTYDETTESYIEYIQNYFPYLSEKEKGRYWNSIKNDFEIYNSLAMRTYDKNNKALGNVYNYKLATKAILLSSSTKLKERITNSGNGDLLFRFQLYNEKKDMLTKGLSMSAAEREVNGINIGELEREINALEKGLSEESEDFAKAFESELFTWKDVRKNLKENEYAIEIIRFRHFDHVFTDSVIYAALILHRKSKGPQLVLFENGSELEKKYFKYYRNGIKYKVNKDKYSYSKFWQAIDQELNDNSKIFISADGVYNQINVETLKDASGKYVIEKNDIYNISNTKDIVLSRRDGYQTNYSNSTAVMLGNPSFSGNSNNINTTNKVSSIEPLPGAEAEIKSVDQLLEKSKWDTRVYLQSEATEQELKKINSPRVCHIATHGFFMENTAEDNSKSELKGEIVDNPLLRSGLLLTDAGELLANNNIYDFNKKDGILTAFEAMNLNLDHTELVVLSACETGVGEIKSGEGVYGLQRSFIVAGAHNVIMTLFKVNDEITQELMNDFYTRWLDTGDMRGSFQKAKLSIKEKHQKPIYWGSFVLIGM